MRRGQLDEETRRVVQRNCRRFRRELGPDATQQDVADLAQLSVYSISRYEGGRGIPDRDAMLQLADAFGRRVEDFYAPSPPPPDMARRRYRVTVKHVGTPPSLKAKIDRAIDRLVREYERQQQRRLAKPAKPTK